MYATQTNGSDLGIEVSYTAASPNNNFLNHQKSMSNNIKPSEVSEVLLQQLKDLATDVKFEEVGVVLTVGDDDDGLADAFLLRETVHCLRDGKGDVGALCGYQ